MTKKLIFLSIIFISIFEYLLIFLVNDKYGEIMWIGKISVYLIIIIIFNIILFLRPVSRFKSLFVQTISLIVLLLIPIPIFLFKPEYTVGEALNSLEDRQQDSLVYTHFQKYKNEKVYVFYSKRTEESYFFNPYNGDFGNLNRNSY